MSKAWVLHNVGDIRYEEVEKPLPSAGEVLIRVMTAGICSSDIPRIYTTGTHKMPLVPGHEFSGVVTEVGSNADPALIGRRVAVYPKISCGKCAKCLEGHPEMCVDYDYTGSRRDGAFAEYVTVPVQNLMELPDDVTFEQGAMIEPMAVAVNAFFTGICDSRSVVMLDSPVAVCGLGPIGLMLIMLLKDMGYENILAIGNRGSQLDLAKTLGVKDNLLIDSRSENVQDRIRLLTGESLACFYECTGRNEGAVYGMESLSTGGKLILVGNPDTDMSFAKDTYWNILKNQITVCGIWNSTFPHAGADELKVDDWTYALEKIKTGKINPEKLISHRLSLHELEKGLLIMRDRTEDRCKIMLTVQNRSAT